MSEPALETAPVGLVCPTCGRPIDPPSVEGDGSVWAKTSAETQPAMAQDEIQRQLLAAQERVVLCPDDPNAHQTLWVWQEVSRGRFRRGRSRL